MFDLGKIVEGITKAVTGGANPVSMLSAFGSLDASKMQVVQAVMTAVQKVQFPELMEAVKKGDYQAVIAMVMDSKNSMPDFHKAFAEAGGEKALEEASKTEEVVTEAPSEVTEPETVVEEVVEPETVVEEIVEPDTETVVEEIVEPDTETVVEESTTEEK
jgi:outer membrane biosynthesis protein TonB